MPISREHLDNGQRERGTNSNFQDRGSKDADQARERDRGDYNSNSYEQFHLSDLVKRPESRLEIIARIKRDQKPIWLDDAEYTAAHVRASPEGPSSLLPPVDVGDSKWKENHTRLKDSVEPASRIERPKSAFHAGDFREEDDRRPPLLQTSFDQSKPEATTWTSTSPTDPWYSPSLPVPGNQPSFELFRPPLSRPIPAQARSRAASQSSLSSSFILRQPTSPLAQTSEINDFDDIGRERMRSKSPNKSSRRHTFSPRSLRATQYSLTQDSPAFANVRPFPILRREGTEPLQRPDKRRSIAAISNTRHHSTPQTPLTRSRRTSVLSDGSPLQANLVGGYEESILRGRMSTLPSRPLDFVAQIGVLGKGNCKKSLRCPPHISVPFPAVYYNYGNTREGPSTLDGPSPYVGLIDLEHITNDSHPNRDFHLQNADNDTRLEDCAIETKSSDPRYDEEYHVPRQKSRNTTSKKTPKGAYRIPQQGQLQIIIKNPNKTAVKLFLIPYDLTGMESGQKTFIRQRSYSAGPIIDMPLSCRTNYGSDRPEASLSVSTDPKDRPVLRYLIHLNICCPSRGRFYLYRSIRVVFANRVPDGKEKLRCEIQLPEPRYSTFKPEPDLTPSARLSDDNAGREEHANISRTPPPLPTRHHQPEFYFPTMPEPRPSFIRQAPHSEKQVMSFHRRPLPTAVSEGSSNGSGSSHKSDPMRPSSPEELKSAKSGESNRSPEAGFGYSDSGSPAFNRNGTVANLESQIRHREQSPPIFNGLISLQLRGMARNGSPNFQS